MPAITEYSNVYNSALLIIINSGYQVWLEENSGMYFAEKEGWDFCSDSPVGLLGLIKIHEFLKPEKYVPNWWKIEGKDVYNSIKLEPEKYISVIKG